MQIKKELFFKLIIILFNLLLLTGGAFLLFYYDVVDFDWSRKVKQDHQYSQSKSKGRRILILGDSQLEHTIADQSISKLMTAFCEKNDIGFANGAHYGFGPNEYLDRLEEYVYDYKPDLVILFYNVHNDLTDVMLKYDEDRSEVTHGLVKSIEKSGGDTNPSKSNDAVENSDESEKVIIQENDEFDWEGFRAFGFDDEIIQFAKNRLNDPTATGPEYINPHILVLAQWKPDYFTYNLSLPDAHSRYMWYKILKIFEKMLDVCEMEDSKFVLVALPSTLQVDDSHFEFYERLKMTVNPDWIHSNKPQDLLDTFCLASNVQYLDVLPQLRLREDRHEIYYTNDDHLNDSGQTAVYRMVEENILKPFVLNKERSAVGINPVKFYKTYSHWKREYHLYRVRESIGLEE